MQVELRGYRWQIQRLFVGSGLRTVSGEPSMYMSYARTNTVLRRKQRAFALLTPYVFVPSLPSYALCRGTLNL